MDFVSWMKQTHRLAEQPLRAALAAAEQGDAQACAGAARQAALVYLRRYLAVIGEEEQASGESVVRLQEAAARRDAYFARLAAEARLLDAGAPSGAGADDFLDAMKEIRLMAPGRAGLALGFEMQPDEPDPWLKQFLTHSTTTDRACSIFATGALYSFNRCRQRGLLAGEPVGFKYLLDPRRCLDFVIFAGPDHKYYAGEKVANSQRKGIIDEALEEDYQPSVRLFCRRDEIQGLPGFDDDGLHHSMVRDEVSLDHLACAVFPSEEARDAALARVQEAEHRTRLTARSLVAPRECCKDPRSYVAATNTLVKAHFSG